MCGHLGTGRGQLLFLLICEGAQFSEYCAAALKGKFRNCQAKPVMLSPPNYVFKKSFDKGMMYVS